MAMIEEDFDLKHKWQQETGYKYMTEGELLNDPFEKSDARYKGRSGFR